MNYYTDALKKYVVFQGRARRTEYWMFVLINFIVSIVVGIIGNMIHFTFLQSLYVLATLLPSIAILIRRLHDTGRSGYWAFIGLIPVVGAIVLLIFAVMDSQPGDNQYGPNPKGAATPVAPQI